MTISSKRRARIGAPEVADRDVRRRLIDALSESIRERGYLQTTVGDIVRNAHTSRRTFYETFSTKDDCIAALMDRHSDHLCARITAAVDLTAPWAARVRQAVVVLIGFLAAEPSMSRAWLRDMAIGGPVAADARRRCTERLAHILVRLSEPQPAGRFELSPNRLFLAFMVISGICDYAADALDNSADVQTISSFAQQAAVSILGAEAITPDIPIGDGRKPLNIKPIRM